MWIIVGALALTLLLTDSRTPVHIFAWWAATGLYVGSAIFGRSEPAAVAIAFALTVWCTRTIERDVGYLHTAWTKRSSVKV